MCFITKKNKGDLSEHSCSFYTKLFPSEFVTSGALFKFADQIQKKSFNQGTSGVHLLTMLLVRINVELGNNIVGPTTMFASESVRVRNQCASPKTTLPVRNRLVEHGFSEGWRPGYDRWPDGFTIFVFFTSSMRSVVFELQRLLRFSSFSNP